MGSNLAELPIDNQDNPLDCVEDVLTAHNWTFSRMNDEELVVTVAGDQCEYNIYFIWQEEFEALQFCCQYDLKIPDSAQKLARNMLAELNENLWLGHFEIMNRSTSPSFRHTCLYRGLKNSLSAESIEDLVEIAMAQCERHYPIFALLASGHVLDEQLYALAMMNTQGRS